MQYKSKIKKILLASVLIIIMISAVIMIVLNRDTIFQQRIVINYPDGCIEEYINSELITPECTYGRQLVEQQNRGPIWNLTIKNLT